MTGEKQGILEPYQQACDEEVQEISELFDDVINSFVEGRHKADGPVKEVQITEASGNVTALPIRVSFTHDMYNVGKVQILQVFGVTPKQIEVELGRAVRTSCIGHTIGEGPRTMIDVQIGQNQDVRRLDKIEEIFADEDARKLFEMLRQYSS